MLPGLRRKDIASLSGGSNNARYGRPTQGRSLTSGGEVKPGFNFLSKIILSCRSDRLMLHFGLDPPAGKLDHLMENQEFLELFWTNFLLPAGIAG
jgi:hypothetical protein